MNIVEKFVALSFLYQDKLDAVIEQLLNDFNELRKEMYAVHHLDVKYLGKEGNEVRYTVNNEVITYSPEDLRKMTEDVMNEYLFGSKATSFDRKERPWKE